MLLRTNFIFSVGLFVLSGCNSLSGLDNWEFKDEITSIEEACEVVASCYEYSEEDKLNEQEYAESLVLLTIVEGENCADGYMALGKCLNDNPCDFALCKAESSTVKEQCEMYDIEDDCTIIGECMEYNSEENTPADVFTQACLFIERNAEDSCLSSGNALAGCLEMNGCYEMYGSCAVESATWGTECNIVNK